MNMNACKFFQIWDMIFQIRVMLRDSSRDLQEEKSKSPIEWGVWLKMTLKILKGQGARSHFEGILYVKSGYESAYNAHFLCEWII